MSSISFENRLAVITGAGGGLGETYERNSSQSFV
jgi:NADP-dependent 3-hydroxy acid dehydrogenase YdfG